jgi:glycerol-3-phosphate cytidylyltransferase
MRTHPTPLASPHESPAGLLAGALQHPGVLTLAPTVAITYGTYDLFHIGHVNLFRRIKEQYDVLVVAVSTDEFNAIKGKRSAVPYADRVEMVRACRYVDLAIPESGWGQKETDIVAYNADAMVMGSDWTGHFDTLSHLCDVVYLPRTEGVSSSDLKSHIKGEHR